MNEDGVGGGGEQLRGHHAGNDGRWNALDEGSQGDQGGSCIDLKKKVGWTHIEADVREHK